MEKLYLNSGGRETKLPSGDTGFYVDLCIEEMEKIIAEHKEDILRSWHDKRNDVLKHSVRILVSPKKEITDKTLYKYYLEILRKPDR